METKKVTLIGEQDDQVLEGRSVISMSEKMKEGIQQILALEVYLLHPMTFN